MSVDTYTKGLLTVIAACLVWMCLNGSMPAIRAQTAKPETTRVVLVDANGTPVTVLPVMLTNRSMNVAVTNPSLDVAVRSIQRGTAWDSIQVQVLRDPPTPMPRP